MRTMSLAILLALAPSAAAMADDSDETAPVRQAARRFRDEAGAFSPAMGRQASLTAALGETAFTGVSLGGFKSLQAQEDEHGQVDRMWSISALKDSLRTERWTALDQPGGIQNTFGRWMIISRG